MSSLKEKLGARIQEIRKSKKLTQEKLAEKIGLDTPNLSNIERGKRFVTAETLENIIKALEVTEKELFDFNHMQTREEIINEINQMLAQADDSDITSYYRLMKLYKEIK
ncbi:MAG: helix-turn-helix transcriptional regulator [bacterium]|nr:helix-turn-helix transcriptional regulator [bacterium]